MASAFDEDRLAANHARRVQVERIKLGLVHALKPLLTADARAGIEVEIGDAIRWVQLSVRCHVLAVGREESAVEFEHTADWWEAVKERTASDDA